MKRTFFRLGRAVLLAYLVAVLLVAGCQNKLLCLPTRGSEEDLLAEARKKGIEPWRDANGKLIGWRKPNPRAANRLVVFHGNAGNAIDRDYYIDGFQSLDGGAAWEVWVFEYPGYGARSGSPGRSAFRPAGRSAIEALLAADSRPLFLLGESIGSGTACDLASELPDRIAGLALVVPLARLQEVAQEKLPWVPVGLILRDKYDNIAALGSYHGRVAVVVAAEDEVIGAAQGRKLHENYHGPKLLIILEGAGHNSFDIQPHAAWIRQVSSFLRGK